jgi:hypothetical protein
VKRTTALSARVALLLYLSVFAHPTPPGMEVKQHYYNVGSASPPRRIDKAKKKKGVRLYPHTNRWNGQKRWLFCLGTATSSYVLSETYLVSVMFYSASAKFFRRVRGVAVFMLVLLPFRSRFTFFFGTYGTD